MSSSAQTSTSPPSHQFDVLVVGAGAAGLYTALCLPAHLQVGLITKDTLSRSASDWAQGGIAAVVDPGDSPSLHLQDTLRAGADLCDYPAVKFLVEQAPDCIHNLIKMGVAFDRHNGDLALTLEAAHSRRRVLHAADTTGRAVVNTLINQALNRKNIQIISQAFTIDLWMNSRGSCQGVNLLYQGHVLWLRAKAVVLATGGGGQVFAQTTNPALSTGDGVAIAHRAGAILRDLEFVQFHPTALTQPGAPRFLISEAVRGEGAHLVDAQGRRFAFDYHPAGELAPRDVVSRAIFSYLQKTNLDPASAHVQLDLRPIPPETIQHRFPNIIQVCQQWGIDVLHEPIPVAPAAHYWMGGIATDLMNRTSIPGLFAVGETASTGVHGANRLASNSLLECIVFGAQFAYLEAQEAEEKAAGSGQRAGDGGGREDEEDGGGNPFPTPHSPFQNFPPSASEIAQIEALRQDLPPLVWQSAGICREGTRMVAAIAQIQQWQHEFAHLSLSQSLPGLEPEAPIHFNATNDDHLRLWGETRNLLEIASLILKSANFRTESRGGHYRLDFPETNPDWRVHTLVQANHWWKSPVQVGDPSP
ncbi:L-aspartate oxidase [Kovacikia minuta CCNUW1]|uniref:L-aspartate oxidase n=1 Tax=Kovacikia minuta TaxID=2931930 RepID=UPI001CCC6C0B|nr:L-aspartate oxidase [Kovacikia minuta]UBF25225.1 L-aspartate oxidase [Kovacikia minuta CCNUW1]